MSGIIEVDETYFGGKDEFKHKDKRFGHNAKKTIIFGALQRNGNVATRIVKNVQAYSLLPLIEELVQPGSHVMSDELAAYRRIPELNVEHSHVSHKQGLYGYGNVHTNSIEGFWSQFKRSVDGTHHVVSLKYLPLYLAEYAYRYSNRQSAIPMFHLLLARA